MNTIRHHPFLVAFYIWCLTILITACGSTTPNPGISSSPTASARTPTRSITAQPVSTTAAGSLPFVSTSCPPQGTARVAVMPPLALGSHQNIVYVKYQGGINTPTPSILQRYDVTTGSTTQIVRMPDIRITEAQGSVDGQWILFVAGLKLQMIRMDGLELQTLYCASGSVTEISNVQWSPDQKQVIFYGGGHITGVQALYLLDIVHGTVQTEMSYSDPSTLYMPRTWIDARRVYLLGGTISSGGPEPTPVPVPKLYILDTTKGANQQTNTLQFVAQAQSPNCWDFDSSYDTGKLFIDHCLQLDSFGEGGAGLRQGPSSITEQSATGGQSNTVYTNPKQAIVAVRVVGYTSASLLFVIENQSYQNTTVDTSQNGLWKINTDGSGLTRLTTENAGDRTSLNAFTQYPWSNFSRDGSMYAARTAVFQGNSPPLFSLIFGSIGAGTPTTFATLPQPGEGALLEVVGWTAM
jgi:eukaryotic-like serine/threonine-protein kinase